MLTRLVVHAYTWIIEVILWLMLLFAGVAGSQLTVPMLRDAGWLIESERAWQIGGAGVFVLVAFLVLAILVGPVLVLVDIRRIVRSLEPRSSGKGTGALPNQRREPSL